MTDTKWCPRCEEHRNIFAFGPDLRTKSGRRSWCERCEDQSLVCMCEVVAIAANHECVLCHHPVVAGMAPELQEVMDDKWPEWRDQEVVRSDEMAAAQ